MEVTSMPKTLETEFEFKTPLPTKATEIQNPRPLSFTINGVLKRQKYQNHPQTGSPIVISYKECLRNHAATLGGHALDGCGEFMPSPAATPADPTSLKCSACGCHRNFHRREPEGSLSTQIVEYKRRNQPSSPISPPRRSPNSLSPPPLSSSYYPSAPHMLLALSTGLPGAVDNQSPVNPDGRKRYRTKFSQEQKEKMFSFSEKLGWKMQKSDEGMVDEFCNEVGVGKGVLKVWMHNNKHTLGKKDVNSNNIITNSLNNPNNQNNNSSGHHLATNGSSSSS